MSVALAWSVRGGWRALQAAPPASRDADLRAFDGLRVMCLMFVIIEHVCWITTHTYLADTRLFEKVTTVLLSETTPLLLLMRSLGLFEKVVHYSCYRALLTSLKRYFTTRASEHSWSRLKVLLKL